MPNNDLRATAQSCACQQDSAERAFNKLARTFAAQIETFKKYRTGGEQKVTVQHVTVSDNAQPSTRGAPTEADAPAKENRLRGSLLPPPAANSAASVPPATPHPMASAAGASARSTNAADCFNGRIALHERRQTADSSRRRGLRIGCQRSGEGYKHRHSEGNNKLAHGLSSSYLMVAFSIR